MVDIFGIESIYLLPEDLKDITDMRDIPAFPSPNELKYKFIVKCKGKRIFPKIKNYSSQVAFKGRATEVES